MHLVRHHLRPKVCPHCEANTSTMPYEDVGPRAAWIQTVGSSKPWKFPPVFARLPGGDEASFIKLDTFHLGPLGAGYYLGPSVLCLLISEYKHFVPLNGKSDVESRLAEAYSFFASYCKRVSASPRDLKEFSKSNLHWPDRATYPMLSCKAQDTNLLIGWLEDYLTSIPHDMSDGLLQLCLQAVASYNQFWRLLYASESRVWWSRLEASCGLNALTSFLRAYQSAALTCFRRILGCSKPFFDALKFIYIYTDMIIYMLYVYPGDSFVVHVLGSIYSLYNLQ